MLIAIGQTWSWHYASDSARSAKESSSAQSAQDIVDFNSQSKVRIFSGMPNTLHPPLPVFSSRSNLILRRSSVSTVLAFHYFIISCWQMFSSLDLFCNPLRPNLTISGIFRAPSHLAVSLMRLHFLHLPLLMMACSKPRTLLQEGLARTFNLEQGCHSFTPLHRVLSSIARFYFLLLLLMR